MLNASQDIAQLKAIVVENETKNLRKSAPQKKNSLKEVVLADFSGEEAQVA